MRKVGTSQILPNISHIPSLRTLTAARGASMELRDRQESHHGRNSVLSRGFYYEQVQIISGDWTRPFKMLKKNSMYIVIALM